MSHETRSELMTMLGRIGLMNVRPRYVAELRNHRGIILNRRVNSSKGSDAD